MGRTEMLSFLQGRKASVKENNGTLNDTPTKAKIGPRRRSSRACPWERRIRLFRSQQTVRRQSLRQYRIPKMTLFGENIERRKLIANKAWYWIHISNSLLEENSLWQEAAFPRRKAIRKPFPGSRIPRQRIPCWFRRHWLFVPTEHSWTHPWSIDRRRLPTGSARRWSIEGASNYYLASCSPVSGVGTK